MLLRASDDAAVIWTKPDDLTVDLAKPMRGLEKLDGILVAMGDGGVRQFRPKIDPEKMKAMFTIAGGEVVDIDPGEEMHIAQDRRNNALFGDWKLTDRELQDLEDLGFDLNKLRRFLRDGIGDQIGLHMHDASKFLDFDVANALSGQGSAGFGGGLGGPEMFGIGVLVQFVTGPSSISIPVKNQKIVDEFLDDYDRFLIDMKAKGNREFGGVSQFTDFYLMEFPKPYKTRCFVAKFAGLKWRLYWGRIGDGLYLANRPFILEDLAAAHTKDKQAGKPSAPAHAMIRVRPENWKEVLTGYNLGWAENQRSACLSNLSMLENVHRGWNDRKPAGGAPDTALMDRVARLYGVRPFCPDGGSYTFSADGKTCSCSIHHSARDPRQPTAAAETSATGKVLKSLAGINATLRFDPEGLRAVVTVERKE
jgi:hypothetical protein